MMPMAPAVCALIAFWSNEHEPRSTRTVYPIRDPAGKAAHAVPLSPVAVTSIKGADIAANEMAKESPSKAEMFLRLEAALDELTLMLGLKTCEFVLAPTVITEGAMPGLEMELKYG